MTILILMIPNRSTREIRAMVIRTTMRNMIPIVTTEKMMPIPLKMLFNDNDDKW